jgi:hypothetical protein
MLLKFGNAGKSVTDLHVTVVREEAKKSLIENPSSISLNLALQFADSVISSI